VARLLQHGPSAPQAVAMTKGGGGGCPSAFLTALLVLWRKACVMLLKFVVGHIDRNAVCLISAQKGLEALSVHLSAVST
jgi:hypothetical protein